MLKGSRGGLHENTWKCAELELHFPPSGGVERENKNKHAESKGRLFCSIVHTQQPTPNSPGYWVMGCVQATEHGARGYRTGYPINTV